MDADRVAGTVLEIGDAELAQADEYAVDADRRVAVTLASGLQAWVDVDARPPRLPEPVRVFSDRRYAP